MNVDDERYETFDDPYCYPNSHVLRNLAGIEDADRLDSFELEMSTLRSGEALPEGDFDFTHYKAVHHHLFQDVYEWAGRRRTVRISKGGTTFCYPENIDAQAAIIFRKLSGPAIEGQINKADFIAVAADFLAELNAIHCFRDGNGRSQLAFMYLVGQRAGFPLNFEGVQRETFLPAMIASFGGNLELLRTELAALCGDAFD